MILSREHTRLNCSLCETRKEKRFCPALDAPDLCRVLWHPPRTDPRLSQRLLVLEASARHHRLRPELLEDERWFAHVQIEEDLLDAHPVLLQDLVESIMQSALANSSLRDRDVIDALTALVRSFETRAHSGLHYEPPRPSLAQQALIEELREVIADYDEEGREMGDPYLRDSDALKALVFVLRLARYRSSGRPLSRGFLDFLRTEFKKYGSNTQRPALSYRNRSPTDCTVLVATARVHSRTGSRMK